ncbi:stalk domain-containing protein [Paenibacillus sp. Soil724D2]|uniref:stalk domain-containing protein n=1 Tax=Paenibacillus sp. (strain Soil724D2) TaxID=1736392 RepID=UPI000713533B|nr:stalk domain-containing protein [Paenibacillus sp. Soil724D2]KRE45965.1 hypothetical protein ASG85_30895 [Paenibacillus sp. Soil724D2]
MKKFLLGLSCGFVIACSSVAVASDTIQALLFPASFEINGNTASLNNDYKVLNVDGHAYVPIRFVAENLGATIDYDADTNMIFVKNGNLTLIDPNYKGISVGNLILTKKGENTKVTGQLKMEGMGNTKNMIGANLSFYNDKSEKIGEVAISGNDFGVDAQTFVSEGLGDFRAYSTVNLHIGAINNRIISQVPSITYENKTYNFTLKLPKRWEGKYEVANSIFIASKRENFDFIDRANKEFGGVSFTLSIWTKEDWQINGEETARNSHLSKIGEEGDRVFTLSTPTDVQYNLQDEKLKAEYLSMYDDIINIKTTFEIKH